MPKENEIRKVLEDNFKCKHYYGVGACNCNDAIDTALSQLKSAMMECLPEKRKVDWKPKEDNFLQKINFDRAIGYNQATTETLARIERMFG